MSGIRARQKAERPGEILEAAFEEFVLKGYAATRLEDVAARVGVTKGTIYFYFQSKETVFEASIQDVAMAELVHFARYDIKSTGDIISDIGAYLDNLYKFVVTNLRLGETLRLLVAEANRFPGLVDAYFQKFMDPPVERLRRRLDEAVANHEIRADASCLSEVVIAPVLAQQMMVLFFGDRRQFDHDGYFQAHFDLLVAGLRSAKGPDPDMIDRPGGASDATDATAVVVAAFPGAAWTDWRSFPDPRRGESLTAPLGPGVYELRLRTGELLLFGSARSVVSRMTTLLPAEIKPERRGSTSRRRFLLRHLGDLEYRTLGCMSYSEARQVAERFDRGMYKFVVTCD